MLGIMEANKILTASHFQYYRHCCSALNWCQRCTFQLMTDIQTPLMASSKNSLMAWVFLLLSATHF